MIAAYVLNAKPRNAYENNFSHDLKNQLKLLAVMSFLLLLPATALAIDNVCKTSHEIIDDEAVSSCEITFPDGEKIIRDSHCGYQQECPQEFNRCVRVIPKFLNSYSSALNERYIRCLVMIVDLRIQCSKEPRDFKLCRLSDRLFPSDPSVECVDSDNDGFGWDGQATCIVEGYIPQPGECVDLDGDGYGWDGIATCFVESEPS